MIRQAVETMLQTVFLLVVVPLLGTSQQQQTPTQQPTPPAKPAPAPEPYVSPPPVETPPAFTDPELLNIQERMFRGEDAIETRFLEREEALRRKERAKEDRFLQDSRDFYNRAWSLSHYRYADMSQRWARRAVDEEARELEKRLDGMIRFLLDGRRFRASTTFTDEPLHRKVAALSILANRILAKLDGFLSEDVVDVATFEELVQELIVAKGLCSELRGS